MRSASNSDKLSRRSRLSHPLVSVIIAYYKQERFIAETLRSIQQQTYPNIEIIVVDDGSPVPASSLARIGTVVGAGDAGPARTDHSNL